MFRSSEKLYCFVFSINQDYSGKTQYVFRFRFDFSNKKVLLRERKRHTACRVVSTPSVVLTPPPSWPGWEGVPYLGTPPVLTWPGGYPTWVPPRQGTPLAGPGRVPPWLAGYPPPPAGPGRVPSPPAGPGRVPSPLAGPGRVPPPPRLDLAVYPPRCLPHGILGNVAKHYGIWVPPLGVDKLTKWNYYLPVVLRTRAVIMILRRTLVKVIFSSSPKHQVFHARWLFYTVLFLFSHNSF